MADINEILGTDILHSGDFAGVGDLELVSGLENIKIALIHRLVTEPGSIIHRPTYGVGIRKFQNAPSTISTQRQIALLIDEQFRQDPRVEDILGVQVIKDDRSPEKTTIIIRVKIIGYGEAAMQFTPFGEV